MPSFHTSDVETLVLQTKEKMLAQCTSLKAYPFDRMFKSVQTIGDVINLAKQFSLHANRAPRINDAKRNRPQ